MADEAPSHEHLVVAPAGDASTPAPAATTSAVGTPGGPATGTITPALSELPPEQVEYSLKVSLADLCAKGAAHYGQKSYEEAAEVYARAAEMQAEMNGEMSPDNAEILFLYGRSLFKVGQGKSDVLGGKAPEKNKKTKPAGEKKANGKKEQAVKAESSADAAAKTEEPSEAQRITEEGVAIIAAETTAGKEETAAAEAKKPLFKFEGDENWDDSDEDEDAAQADGEAEGDEEEDDDLAVAFEILDLSRLLFTKRLEISDAADADDKGKEVVQGDSLELKHIKERLGDTHDLLAEISLENERYPNAIIDFESALNYKKQLYPKESEIIAEAHFKLSLALEFSSVTSSAEDNKESGTEQVDQELRDRAATEMAAAIESTKLKLQNKEVDLATMHSPDDNEVTRKQIAEVKDIIADMEARLVDLRKPPIDINAALNGPAANAMGGILGAALGESAEQTQERIEEAKKSAKDLSGLVRKKAKDADAPTQSNGAETNGKRKAEDSVASEESKKARVEDAAEA